MEETLEAEINDAKTAQTKLETTMTHLQQEKKKEMARTKERLKQQFAKVTERQKQYSTELNVSKKEKVPLEKELAALKEGLGKAESKKACGPLNDGK